MTERELDTLGDRPDGLDILLGELRSPEAPHTLLPRVMAAAGRREDRRPRSWFAWPGEWQVASVLALIVLVAGIGQLRPHAVAAIGAAASPTAAAVSTRVASALHGVGAAAAAAAILWRTSLKPIVCVVFALVIVLCGACAACGTVLRRVALGGT